MKGQFKPKFYYFGKVEDDPDGIAALNKWIDEKDELLAGRKPREDVEGFTVEDLCDHFLTAKDSLLESGEIGNRTYDDYKATCERLIEAFGASRLVDDLAAIDFDKLRSAVAKKWGPVRLGNEIQRIRTVFKFGFDNHLMNRTVRFGSTFKRPTKKVLRIERAKKGPRMFEAKELHLLLKGAGPQLKAMILLGINCGFGNADVGQLPLSALDLAGGWVRFPRPKTGIPRRCKLWPETVKRLKKAIAERPSPKEDGAEGLAFITKYGSSWGKETRDNPITKEFRKLLDGVKLYREGLGFYALRHTFETIGGDSNDQVAVDHVMGHARDDMASVYRERISDERLVAVAEHVRRWLFAARSLE